MTHLQQLACGVVKAFGPHKNQSKRVVNFLAQSGIVGQPGSLSFSLTGGKEAVNFSFLYPPRQQCLSRGLWDGVFVIFSFLEDERMEAVPGDHDCSAQPAPAVVCIRVW